MSKFCSIELLYAFILLIGSFTFGFIISYPSPALQDIKKLMTISSFEETMFNAISALFAIFGSLSATFFISLSGKKITVFVTAILGVISWIILPFVTLLHIWAGIADRALLGIIMGSFSVVVPLCINELAPFEYSGIYGSLSQFGISVGCSACYFISAGLNWRGLTYFETALCILLCAFVWIIPLQKNIQQINNDASQKESIFQRKYAKNLCIGIGCMFFQQFSGINGILTNLNNLFTEAGIPLSTSIASGISSSAQVIAVIIGGIMIQFLGRKFVWIFSTIGSAVALLLYGLTIKFTNWPSIISIVAIFMFLLCFGVGLGPIPWFIVPELFTGYVKSAATSIATAVNWLLAFIVILGFPYLKEAITDFFAMIFFMIILIFGSVFGWFCIGNTGYLTEPLLNDK